MMNEQDSAYAPASPDLSAYHSADLKPQTPSYFPPHTPSYPHQASYLSSVHQQHPAFASPTHHQPLPPPPPPPPQQQYHHGAYPISSPGGYNQYPQGYPPPQMARYPPQLKQERSDPDDDWLPDAATGQVTNSVRKSKVKAEVDYGGKPAPGKIEGIEVRTHFPVARIKRIMQADEDVGKVAQVTPHAVGKALELFMVSLVTKSAAQAKSRNSKKVTATHLKQVVETDQQFDFLAEIVAKVPDAPVKNKDDDSEGAVAGGEGVKKKRGPRRQKTQSDDT